MEIDALFKGIKEMGKFANKDLGQNYLINQDVCMKIVNLLNINPDDDVIELGAGFGSLSIFLLNKDFKKMSYNDIDPRSIEFLEGLKDNSGKNIEIINRSALKLDLSKYSKIISNIPYYITNDLLEHTLTNGDANKYVFMIQKEVYERLDAKENTEDYGPLSILINSIGDIKKEFLVSKNFFIPAPHVDSLVFSISKTKNNRINKYNYLMFLKRMFLHRRKTIYNNLSLYMNNKDKAKDILNDLNISLLIRPEQIDPDKYLAIYTKTL